MNRLECQVRAWDGAEGIRTPDLFLAKEAFSRLNYGPLMDFRIQI